MTLRNPPTPPLSTAIHCFFDWHTCPTFFIVLFCYHLVLFLFGRSKGVALCISGPFTECLKREQRWHHGVSRGKSGSLAGVAALEVCWMRLLRPLGMLGRVNVTWEFVIPVSGKSLFSLESSFLVEFSFISLSVLAGIVGFAILPTIPRKCWLVPEPDFLRCSGGWNQGGQPGTHRRWVLSAIYLASLGAQLLWVACLWAWVFGCFPNYTLAFFGLIVRLPDSFFFSVSFCPRLTLIGCCHSNPLKVMLWLFWTKHLKVINFSLVCTSKLVSSDQLHFKSRCNP